LAFVKYVWPGFIEGHHHRLIADAFDRIADGKLKRLIVSIAPRHTKSEFGSIHFPAYFLGRFPDKKLIMASNTSELAVGFGRKVRNLMNSDIYNELFAAKVAADSRAAARWSTDKGGEFFAIGVGGTMTGRGADLMIIDDPHSEADGMQGMHRPEIFDQTYEWFSSGPRQRLQPGGAMVIISTRWHSGDLVGKVLDASAKSPRSGQWEMLELPAILPSGRPLWPSFWSLEELEAIKAEIPPFKWAAQYMQRPGGSEVAILKRDWWQKWTKKDPPECDLIMTSVDTAFSGKKRSNYSALITWGVFHKKVVHADGREEKLPQVVMLDAWKKQLEFPELKKELLKHHEERNPDIFLIENKGSGTPMIQEFRSMGLNVSEFTPVRGMSKIIRANAISDILQSGRVWYPDDRDWAEMVIAQCEGFPFLAEDDLVDVVTMSLLRFREGGMVGSRLDEAALDEDERKDLRRSRRRFY
jgi:predicted phage terminase large subunit-like protein